MFRNNQFTSLSQFDWILTTPGEINNKLRLYFLLQWDKLDSDRRAVLGTRDRAVCISFHHTRIRGNCDIRSIAVVRYVSKDINVRYIKKACYIPFKISGWEQEPTYNMYPTILDNPHNDLIPRPRELDSNAELRFFGGEHDSLDYKLEHMARCVAGYAYSYLVMDSMMSEFCCVGTINSNIKTNNCSSNDDYKYDCNISDSIMKLQDLIFKHNLKKWYVLPDFEKDLQACVNSIDTAVSQSLVARQKLDLPPPVYMEVREESDFTPERVPVKSPNYFHNPSIYNGFFTTLCMKPRVNGVSVDLDDFVHSDLRWHGVYSLDEIYHAVRFYMQSKDGLPLEFRYGSSWINWPWFDIEKFKSDFKLSEINYDEVVSMIAALCANQYMKQLCFLLLGERKELASFYCKKTNVDEIMWAAVEPILDNLSLKGKDVKVVISSHLYYYRLAAYSESKLIEAGVPVTSLLESEMVENMLSNLPIVR